MNIPANDPSLISWIKVEKDSDFPIQNLPFGIFKTQQLSPRVGVAIGSQVIDMQSLASLGFIKIPDVSVFSKAALNPFMALGKEVCRDVRQQLSDLLNKNNTSLQHNESAKAKVFHNMDTVEMLMPVTVGNYTDFYSSIDHATNVGTMFRDPANALLPNWKHLPVGYHGRASSITVSGTNFHRPKGQTKPADSEVPVFGPCKLLDFELETAFIIGQSTKLGESVTTADADNYIFGMVLFNDWSARDIQTWEYVPLGPFLAKNFASTVSPWVVMLDALEPFRVEGYKQEPKVLPYLQYNGNKNIDIKLQVSIQPKGQEEVVVCNSNYRYMYWTMEQQLAHHTVNGCNINVGDMMASGTISGPTPGSFGSMLELSWKGTKPFNMPDGTERKFIHDYDTVIMRGHCEKDGVRIGFGECRATAFPAL